MIQKRLEESKSFKSFLYIYYTTKRKNFKDWKSHFSDAILHITSKKRWGDSIGKGMDSYGAAAKSAGQFNENKPENSKIRSCHE